SAISFTARSPDDSSPCIHENHGERCSPAKWILPSRATAVKKSLKPTNAHAPRDRSEEHTSELQSRRDLVCRLLLEKKKKTQKKDHHRSSRTRAKVPSNRQKENLQKRNGRRERDDK